MEIWKNVGEIKGFENFFDYEKYAGEGNIGHMILHANKYFEREL